MFRTGRERDHAAAWVLALSLALPRPAPAAARPGAPFDLQGHRGARGLAPENTLTAFARALSIGVTTLELDTAVTRDGVVVVSHDPRLNPDVTRGPNGEWLNEHGPAIASLSWSELQTYDVGRLHPGTPYAAQFPRQLPADGERLPRLSDVFALARKAGNDDVRFNVETKLDPLQPALAPEPEAFVEAVLSVIRQAGVARRTTIQSFDWRTLRLVHTRAPEIETVCLTSVSGADRVQAGQPGASPWLGGLDVDDFGGSVPRAVQAAGCAAWSPYARDLTPGALADAHRLGLRVIPWTVNDTAAMRELVDSGVDGLITDYPDELRCVLEEAGRELPPMTRVTR
jgi:glycerophosphoryl diester phosphodiesterase